MVEKDKNKFLFNEIQSSSPTEKCESNKTIIKFFDSTWLTNLLAMTHYGPENNKGYIFNLVVTDNFCNYGCTLPIKITQLNQ